MALSKKQSMIRTYRQFMEMGLSNEYTGVMPQLIYEKIAGFGTAIDEKIQGIGGFKNLLKLQKRQSKGLGISWKIKPVSHYTSEDGNTAVFADDVYVTIKADKEIMEMYLRISVILNYHNKQWKVIHWHGSKPEQVESEKDTWGVVSWKQRAQELEQLVAEKTADLIKKNRELEIEAALERVRARTMAMQKSDELYDVAHLLHQQLKHLGEITIQVTIGIANEAEKLFDTRVTDWSGQGEAAITNYKMPFDEPSLIKDLYKGWKKKVPSLTIKLNGERLKKWVAYRNKLSGVKIKADRPRIITAAFFSKGFIAFSKYEASDAATRQVLERFTAVFNQTYTRFLDLQKAEAQAREAQIETALERVRSRSLAMHHSSELSEVVIEVYNQLNDLGFNVNDGAVAILEFEEGSRDHTQWIVDPYHTYPTPFRIPYSHHSLASDLINAKESGANYLSKLYSFREKNTYFKFLFAHNPDYKSLPKDVKTFLLKSKEYGISVAFSKHSAILIPTNKGSLLSEEHKEILLRFSRVFDQAYTRFLDLQKAEAQAREAQIEAALERVRSRSLAMHKSEELREVIQLVFEQLRQLNFNIDSAQFDLNYTESDDLNVWTAVPGQLYPILQRIPYFSNPIMDSVKEAKKSGLSFLSHVCTHEEKNEFFRHFFNHVKHVPEERKKYIFDTPGYARSVVFLDTLFLGIQNYAGIPYSDTENAVLKRFGKVFEQSYTRFLDLQKAEAQAWEAQIEAALERIRSRSHAMHKSDDLSTVIQIVLDQFLELKIPVAVANFALNYNDNDDFDLWSAAAGQTTPFKIYIPYFDHPFFNYIKEDKSLGRGFSVHTLTLQEKNSYFEHIFKHSPGVPEELKQYIFSCPGFTQSTVYLNAFSLSILKYESVPFTELENQIVWRFGKVFEQAYTRFLDLQKAEAQAREAQIEAALERVRAQAMAMHQTEDLGKTIMTYYEQLDSLIDSTIVRCGAGLLNKGNTIADMSTASKSPEGKTYYVKGTIDMQGHPLLVNTYDHWLKQKEYHHVLRGNEIQEYYQYITNQVAIPENKGNDELYFYFPMFTEGSFYVVTSKAVPEDELQIFRRFSSVLSLTYRRFNDLQKAEAQAREAQIEAALEKVRSRTMAMQHSSELTETSFLLVKQVLALGIKTWGCAFNIFDEDQPSSTEWFSNEQGYKSMYKIPREGVFLKYYEAAQRGESLHVEEFKGQACIDHYLYLSTLPGLEEEMKIYAEQGVPLPTSQYDNVTFFKYGYLLFVTYEHVPKAHDIFKRFAKVFEQTYTRFLDLKRAEAQALEATKRASVDRVRAEIASMRTVQDLDRITPLIWSELKALGVPFMRCGVFIMDELHRQIQTFLSTPEGKAISSFHLPYDAPGAFNEIVDHWTIKKIYTKHWGEAEFFSVADALVKQGSVANHEQYMSTVPSGVHLHCLPFLQGMLYVGNTEPLREDELQLAQSLADAFSTAYARYEDFNKLEAAKKQVDKTLIDLKQAQQQLVQSEKMASLGELTAGIAHEIQNPLNFVNNFSEVNKELLLEMEDAIQKGNYEEAIILGKDIAANQEKINHHGKRAEGIVKGMLQHSRGSTGQKELTDINALCDEYLRLSYHGYRAKDKSFNAKFETHLDDTIPKIEVMPQDIGRVVLNLINNAFYAVSEKLKVESQKLDSGYEPTVTVSTSKLNGKIEISVRDNGNGIPESIKEKIFQPFFTTKPTGQGTGLGLSLSYDIVKAHGGELRVETKEELGSEFLILLPIV